MERFLKEKQIHTIEAILNAYDVKYQKEIKELNENKLSYKVMNHNLSSSIVST